MATIRAVDELEQTVGNRSLPVMMKSIPRLDPHCVALLAHAPVAALGYVANGGRMRAGLVGGAAGFAAPETPSRLRLPVPADAVPGTGASLLVLVPGWRETLRVNGTVDREGLAVEEAFLHCGKAVIRSGLWASGDLAGDGEAGTVGVEEEGPAVGPAAAAFLAAASFAVIASRDGAGLADASPKGDPPGLVRLVGPTTVAIADRPGNRRTDTFHNVLDDPEVALVVVVPGDERTVELRGTATISTDPALRESMAERRSTPKVVLLVEVSHARLAHNPALREARLWDACGHVDPAELPKPAVIWRDHLAQGEAERDQAAEDAMEAGLELDYQQNLY
ncbi:pyridoxamine 5'-phosphate oxidase family protein [Amycolatopsis jiangsuensis]|uniref:Putative pyridoxine 5'-phosphate oxidase superfamily flavin-nucleotide-binding protein n=1 Tax=Amycolatopsis jiangsuensis TaxID=1181879 RepID=A0A840J060_9PSEU|nr:pyridoxamine 5'-phosphate oxidase family protein [Amycolatopsis jiangsuensis]MBB4686832.1 putative pyridoxine 5'-phosphate oxidase superfamily flavin-nucleotide-binding protein [Amycolatopsis jiangsuensis]